MGRHSWHNGSKRGTRRNRNTVRPNWKKSDNKGFKSQSGPIDHGRRTDRSPVF